MRNFCGFFVLSALLFVSPLAQSRDYSDKNCAIFVNFAQNIQTGGWGNYYAAGIMVKKSLLQQDFKGRPQVVLMYRTSSRQSWSFSPLSDIGATTADGQYVAFTGRLNFGATHRPDRLEVVGLITNNIDTLYDNNSGNSNIELNSGNNWRYTSHCLQ